MKREIFVVGNVKIPPKPERVRHIVLAEEGNPQVPVFTGYRNVKYRFKGVNNDVDTFLKKYPETRSISKEEADTLYAFYKTSQKFQFSKIVGLSTEYSLCYICVFKIEDGRWITLETDERREFYRAQEFSNVKDACYHIISSLKLMEKKSECLKYFESFLINDCWYKNYPSNGELEEFIIKFDYEVAKTKTLK